MLPISCPTSPDVSRLRTYVHTRAHTHAHTYVHTHTHSHTRTNTHAHTSTLTHSLSHMHIHTCTLTHTHTLAHTQASCLCRHSLSALLTHSPCCPPHSFLPLLSFSINHSYIFLPPSAVVHHPSLRRLFEVGSDFASRASLQRNASGPRC